MSAAAGTESRWHLPVLGAILILAVLLRLWGLAWGLHGATVSTRPHPDEWTVFYLVQWFGSYHSLSPCPVMGHQCFFDWGMSFPYFAYGFHLLTLPLAGVLSRHGFGATADMEFVRTVLGARLLSALVSTGTVFLVYRIGARSYGTLAGLLAALCTAISCLLIQLAHFGTPDTTTGFLMTATLLAALRAMEIRTGAAFLLAGVVWGLAAGSEYHMGLLLLPVAAAWFLGRPRPVTYLVGACATALLAYLVVNVYSLVDFSAWLAAMEHTLRIRTVESAAEYGNRWNVYGSPWLYVVRYALGYGVGWPLTVWFVASVAWAVVRRERADILLLAWLIPYFILVSLSPAKFMRYSAPLFPVLVVFAGRMAADLLQSRRAVARLGTGVLAALAVLYTLAYDAAYNGLFSSQDPRSSAAQWLGAHTPRKTYVAYEQLPNGLINMPYFGIAADFRPCFAQFNPARLVGAQRFIVTDSYDLEEHPRFTDHRVRTFRSALSTSDRYRIVERIHPTPSFLGLRFPIDGSPHDWRYPAHVITIYALQKRPSASKRNCFANYAAAYDALYPGGSTS